MRQVVLASSSAYRKELLQRLRLSFDIHSPNIDESALSDEKPSDTALRLARAKAKAVAKEYPGALIVGSDQVAACGALRLGKPGGFEAAFEQLSSVQGKWVDFHTAICLYDAANDSFEQEVVTSRVQFLSLPPNSLASYLNKEKPFDCAGSAKLEGLGITLIERVESSDPSAIIGLPLIALCRMLRSQGIDFY